MTETERTIDVLLFDAYRALSEMVVITEKIFDVIVKLENPNIAF